MPQPNGRNLRPDDPIRHPCIYCGALGTWNYALSSDESDEDDPDAVFSVYTCPDCAEMTRTRTRAERIIFAREVCAVVAGRLSARPPWRRRA